MRFTGVILICLYSLSVAGQKQYNVFDWKAEATLNTYLLQQMHAQYDERRTVLQKALRSREALLAYRDACKSRYKKILNALPVATPLNEKVTGIIQQKKYRV